MQTGKNKTLLPKRLMKQLNMEARYYDKSLYEQNFKVSFLLE